MNAHEVMTRLKRVKQASHALQVLPEAQIVTTLEALARNLRSGSDTLLAANAEDLARKDPGAADFDRLRQGPARIAGIADDVLKVAALSSPIGACIDRRTLPNGIDLRRVRVPLGTVGVIYEARPNVTIDVFALCFRTRNACVLRGGSDAEATNRAFAAVLDATLSQCGIDPSVAWSMPPDRALTQILLTAHGLVDVVIPRGSRSLIDHVRAHARVPVIETGAGVVHIYFDRAGDAAMASPLIANAKIRRPSVCNSLDTLLVHRDRLSDLPRLVAGLGQARVTLHADDACLTALAATEMAGLLVPLQPGDCDREYLSLHANLIAVENIDAALTHIRNHGSGHTEAVITEDGVVAERFLAEVDAAVVLVNASTGFCDGGEFGLGAEIGISTQKLHARGPMGLEALTTYKWQGRGTGQIRA